MDKQTDALNTIKERARGHQLFQKISSPLGRIYSTDLNPLYWLGGIAVLVLGWIVYQVSRWRRAPKAGRPDAVPPGTGGVTPEYKAADDSMGRVSAAYAEGNKQLFYGEALQTVRNVIGERYRVPSNILSKDQLLGTLARDRQPETLRREGLTLMDKCEWALYTPEYNQDDMDETYTMLQSVLQQLKA